MSPAAAPPISRSGRLPASWRRRIGKWTTLAALAGAAIGHGATRSPVDPTRPLQLEGEIEHRVASPTLRVGTFNIHGGRGEQWLTDLEATARVLEDSRLDFVSLHEVKAGFFSDQAQELGDRLGTASMFVPTEHRWWHDHWGNGLLTRRPLRRVIRIDLPGTQNKSFRNAILTTVSIEGVTVSILAAHVDTGKDRDRQLAHVCEVFRTLKSPAILMGDLNCTTGHVAVATLLADPGVVDAISNGPASDWDSDRVDHLLVRGLKVLDSAVVPNGASDHPHIWAELAIEETDELRSERPECRRG